MRGVFAMAYKNNNSHAREIAIIGLGYVGLTLALHFGRQQKIIAFDKNEERIITLKKNYDWNGEFDEKELAKTHVHYTSHPTDLKKADFYIIAVPTPITATKQPDFGPLIEASKLVGKFLKPGDIVVYESTVYPGATEERCIPILEKSSKLQNGSDFTIGYSPERINPGDKEHTFLNTVKIISAQDEHTLAMIGKVYKSIIKVGVYPVSSIRVAEAVKVIENTQRDLNISLINEIAIILHKLDIDTLEVLKAAETKWNFLPFRPGFVGGHCIGVDPYYLTYKAQEVGYYPEVILSGRRINEGMGKFIAERTIKKLIQLNAHVKRSRIAVFGLTYKENCKDLRNTRVVDLIHELLSYGVETLVYDPIAPREIAEKEYGIHLSPWQELKDLDAIVLAVPHQEFVAMDSNIMKELLNHRGLIMDVKGILDVNEFHNTGITLWRL
jgi:UDP-N-acetyl-D-glucosamine/UDP-N-acetyl-D-galactosamine dehydrogenase